MSNYVELDLAPYIERLRARVPQFKRVSGAAELDRALTSQALASPAAYLIYTGDEAQPNELDAVGQHEQLVDASFDVMIAFKNAADALGEKASDGLRPLRVAVVEALAGFTPAPHITPLNRRRSRIWFMAPGVIWWRMSFATQFQMRVIPGA